MQESVALIASMQCNGTYQVRTKAKDAICRLGDARRSLSPEQAHAQPPATFAMACAATSTAAAAMPSS